MRKIFLSNLLLQVALNLIVKPLYIFGIDRTINNTVGASVYGTYFALLNLSLLLQILIDFGIQNFTSKTIAESPNNIQQYFSNLFTFKLLLSVAYLAATFIIALLLGYDTLQLKLLFLLSAVQIASSFFLFFRANLAGLGLFKTDSFLSVFDRLGLLLICTFLLFFGWIDAENGIWYFAGAQVISMFLACFIAFFHLSKYISLKKIAFDVSFLKKIIRESFPFALIAFLMMFYTRIDGILLERLLENGKTEAGIYAAAYRLLDALNSVTLIFGTLLLPLFSKQIGEKTSVLPLLQLSLQLVSFTGITAAILFFSYRFEITALLYPNASTSIYTADVLGLLLLSYIPLSYMYVLGALATASSIFKPQHYLFALCTFANIFLNFFLIHSMQAFGAATATLITQTAVALGLTFINQRKYRFSLPQKAILSVFTYATLLIVTTILIKKMAILWIIQLFLLAFFAIILSIFCSFWDLRKAKQMLFGK